MYEYVCSCLCMFAALNRYVSPERREFYVITFAVYSVDPIARVATSRQQPYQILRSSQNSSIKTYRLLFTYNACISI